MSKDNSIVDNITSMIYNKELVLGNEIKDKFEPHVMWYLDNLIPSDFYKDENGKKFCDSHVKKAIIKKLVGIEYEKFYPIWLTMCESFKEKTFIEAFSYYLKFNLYL